ncbi:MAG TPA: hypothetical protein PKK98_05460 [Candidatus Aminicenantes bacterium]|nr:hypothetical protein [Candidatus Aminicenantes bacterium]
MRRGTVAYLVLLLIGATLYYELKRATPNLRFRFDGENHQTLRKSDLVYSKKSLSESGITRLNLDACYGEVEVVKEEGLTAVTVEATVGVPKGKSFELRSYREGSTLTVGFPEGYNPDGDLIVEIGYKVRVPEPIELRLNHRYGTALLSDLKGVEIDDRFSRIELSQIDSLKGTLKNGSATIDGVGGDVSLDASFGELTLENVKGTVKLTSRHSTGTELSNIDGDLIFEGKYSPLRITRVKGTTKITDSYQSVDIEDCGTVEFTGDYGKIGIIRSPRFLLKGGNNALSSEEVKEIRVEGKYNRVSGDADFLTLSGRADNVVATLKGADITEEGGKLSLEFPDLTLSSRFDLIDTTSALEFGPSQKIRFQVESYMNRLRSNFLTITSQGDTHTGTAGDANSPVSFILKSKYSDISLDRED